MTCHHVLGARHLWNELWIDEAGRLDAFQAGRRQSVAQVRPHRRVEQPLFVLQPVSRPDVTDDDAHIDKGRAASDRLPAALGFS